MRSHPVIRSFQHEADDGLDRTTEESNNIAGQQDRVFELLTNVALCIGDCFMLCEKEALDERESLDAARRHLVALWVKSYKGLAHSQQDQNIFTATVV